MYIFIPRPCTILCSNTRKKSHAVVQGRFKQSMPFSSVHTGLAYDDPLETLPAQWSLLRITIQLLSRLQPGSRVALRNAHPYVLIPLMTIAQNIGNVKVVWIHYHNASVLVLQSTFPSCMKM
jgi:hypothetical protein